MAYFFSDKTSECYDDLTNTVTYLATSTQDSYEIIRSDDVPVYYFYETLTKRVKAMRFPFPFNFKNFNEVTETFYLARIKELEALEGCEERFIFSSYADEIGSIRAAEIDADNTDYF